MDKEKTLPAHLVCAAGVVRNEKGEILMVRHHRQGWVYPGGIVESGENVIDAVKREILEETGVRVQVGELFCVASNTTPHPGYNGVREVPPKVNLDFLCTYLDGGVRPSDENAETRWVPLEEVPSMITHGPIIDRFRAFLTYRGRPAYLEYGTHPEYVLKLKTTL